MTSTPVPPTIPRPSRRAVLGGLAAAAAAAPLIGVRAAGAQEAGPDLAPFPHGVASGDPTATNLILWTRVDPDAVVPATTGPIELDWVVFTDLDDPEGSVATSGTATAAPERDWTVKLDVGGLAPRTTYFFEFTAPDGRRSLIGRARTAPSFDSPAEDLRFGVVGCSNYPAGWFNAYAALAQRQDLDAVLHTGDYQYEYADAGTERPVGDFETVTLDQYRARTKAYRLDPDLRRLHQLFPMICTWDDHESTNNSFYGGAENHQPGPISEGGEGDWFDRKDASAQAYDEYLPFRKPDQSQSPFDPAAPRTYQDGMRIYRAVPYGPRAVILVLDTRIEGRDPEASTPAVGPEAVDPDRTMLGRTQKEWLKQSLVRAQAGGYQWKVLLQQVMFQQWNVGGIPTAYRDALPGLYEQLGDGGSINGDAWDGYAAEREELLDHIESEGISDVVILTGDIHMAFAADIAKDPYDPTVYDPLTGRGSLAVELVTASVTSSGLGEIAGPEAADALALASRAGNPHQKHTDFKGHGFFVLTLTAERAQADWYDVDTITERDASHALAMSLATDTGTNHLVPVGEAATGTDDPAPTEAPRVDAPPPVVPEFSPGLGLLAAGGAAAGIAALRARRDRVAAAGEPATDG